MSRISKIQQWRLSLKQGLIKAGFLRPPGPKEEGENLGPEEKEARQKLLHITEQRRPNYRR